MFANKFLSSNKILQKYYTYLLSIQITCGFLAVNGAPTPNFLDPKTGKVQGGENSMDDFIHRLDSKLETKFDVIGNKINNINRNVEMLDSKVDEKFETLSSKENHLDHKLDSLESKVNRKIDDMQVKSEQTFTVLGSKLDQPQVASTWPMSSFWYWLLGLDVILTVVCRIL